MSSLPVVYEAAYTPTPDNAEVLDKSFNEIAETIPLEVKLAEAGIYISLHEEPGVGKIEAAFLGIEPAPAGSDYRQRHLVRLAMWSYEQPSVGFWKDYDLRDYHEVEGGRPHELEPTDYQELVECPDPVIFWDMVRILHEGYMQKLQQSDDTVADVIQLDDYRND